MPEDIGRARRDRAVARLNPTRPRPGRMPVLFDPRVASTLLGHFAGAISGSAVARKSSFLQDRPWHPGVRAGGDHHRRPVAQARTALPPVRWRGAAVLGWSWLSNGVLTAGLPRARRRASLASSRPAMLPGAGGAPGAGPSNLYIAAGRRSRCELFAAFPDALLVTELIGQGVNGVTGDYSRGAAGFLVQRRRDRPDRSPRSLSRPI